MALHTNLEYSEEEYSCVYSIDRTGVNTGLGAQYCKEGCLNVMCDACKHKYPIDNHIVSKYNHMAFACANHFDSMLWHVNP